MCVRASRYMRAVPNISHVIVSEHRYFAVCRQAHTIEKRYAEANAIAYPQRRASLELTAFLTFNYIHPFFDTASYVYPHHEEPTCYFCRFVYICETPLPTMSENELAKLDEFLLIIFFQKYFIQREKGGKTCESVCLLVLLVFLVSTIAESDHKELQL